MSITQTINSANEYAMIRERDDAIDRLNRAEGGVSVCIPTFNDADCLPHAVASVLSQTVKPVEVIVVDDGSDAPVTLTWAHEGVDLRVVRVTNRGLPAARNVALMLARGHAFLPLDADDWVEPTYIEKTLPLLADADVVLTGLQEHGPTRNGCYMPGFDRPWNQVTWELIVHDYNRFFYASLYRTAALREVGGYNPKMSRGLEDADMHVDFLRRGMRFASVEEPLLHYNTGNPDSMLQTIHRDGGYEEMVKEMKRHHNVV